MRSDYLIARVKKPFTASRYMPLVQIAAKAIASHADTNENAETTKRGRNRRHDTSLGVWRLCKSCEKPFAREKEIQIMTGALEQAGLPAEYLSLCPDCRDSGTSETRAVAILGRAPTRQIWANPSTKMRCSLSSCPISQTMHSICMAT